MQHYRLPRKAKAFLTMTKSKSPFHCTISPFKYRIAYSRIFIKI
ncbi:hypothetical protein [Helicobacter rodentium]|nr:hypothetical protein [Helicobacter rodentium]